MRPSATDVDVAARRTRDRQHLVDRQIGMLAPVALVARQPLELDRGAQLVVLEQRGARVVKIGVQRQDELGHRMVQMMTTRKCVRTACFMSGKAGGS